MLRLTVNTKKSPTEVTEEARRRFAEGLGLRAEEANLGITFSGAGGYVTLVFESQDGGTLVDISTSEFEDAVRKFAGEIG
jgi:hypothetical protein